MGQSFRKQWVDGILLPAKGFWRLSWVLKTYVFCGGGGRAGVKGLMFFCLMGNSGNGVVWGPY